MPEPLPAFAPGMPLAADDLNRLVRAARSIAPLSGPGVRVDSGKLSLRQPDWLWAIVTGGGNPWHWQEAVPDISTPGSWQVAPGARSGSDAYEANGLGRPGLFKLRRSSLGDWRFVDARQANPCPHLCCVTILHLESNAPYAGLTIRITKFTGAGPPTVVFTGTTDSDGKYCFTFAPGWPFGFGAEVDVPTGHGTTITMPFNAVPEGSAACHVDTCKAVCAGRFTLDVTGVAGLTQEAGFSEDCNPDGSILGSIAGAAVIGKVILAVCGCESGSAEFYNVPAGSGAGGYAWDLGAISTCDAFECAMPVTVAFTAEGALDGDGCRTYLQGCGAAGWNCGDGGATLTLFKVDPDVWVDLLCHGGAACCSDVGCDGGDGDDSDDRALIKKALSATFHLGGAYGCPDLPAGPYDLDWVGDVNLGFLAGTCAEWDSDCFDTGKQWVCSGLVPSPYDPKGPIYGKLRFWPCCQLDGSHVGAWIALEVWKDAACTTPIDCAPGKTLSLGISAFSMRLTGSGLGSTGGTCSPTAILTTCVDITER